MTEKKSAAPGVTLEDIGRLLKQERERANLTRSDVSSKTKISIDQIARIEEGKFDHMATVYARGFLRACCEAVGLDPEPILADFRILSQGFDGDINIVPPPPKNLGEGRSRGWTAAGGLVFLALALFAAAMYMSPSMRLAVAGVLPEPIMERLRTIGGEAAPADAAPAVAAAAVEADDGQALAAVGDAPAAPAPAPAAAQTYSGRLTLRAEASTWAQVTVDDQQVEHLIFEAGQLRSFEGEKLITVVCGDGRALRTEWNGEDSGPLGEDDGPIERFFPLAPGGELAPNPS